MRQSLRSFSRADNLSLAILRNTITSGSRLWLYANLQSLEALTLLKINARHQCSSHMIRKFPKTPTLGAKVAFTVKGSPCATYGLSYGLRHLDMQRRLHLASSTYVCHARELVGSQTLLYPYIASYSFQTQAVCSSKGKSWKLLPLSLGKFLRLSTQELCSLMLHCL